MSRFAGWVPYRRGIIEHVLDGRLTGLQHYALSQLILLADAATGGDRTNGPLMAFYMGYLVSHDKASRILADLHTKGYVWFRAKPGSKIAQPYWIQGYVLSRGPRKGRRINLSQLFKESVISQEMVWQAAEQVHEQGHEQGHEQVHDNYKTGDGRPDSRDDPSSDNSNSDSTCVEATTGSAHAAHMVTAEVRTRDHVVITSRDTPSATVPDTAAATAPPTIAEVAHAEAPSGPEQERKRIEGRRSRWLATRERNLIAGQDATFANEQIAGCDAALAALEVQ